MGRPTKAVSKLTVLPPLNLPSLRREHEKFDASGRNGGLGGGGVGGLGSGSRPSSTRVGWTKIVPDNSGTDLGNNRGGLNRTDVGSRTSANYGSRTASSGVGEVSNSLTRDSLTSLEKSIVLRGEEFPSLQAATSTLPATSRKEKHGLSEKQKQVKIEERSIKKKEDATLEPLGESSRDAGRNALLDNDHEGRRVGGGRVASHNQKKQEGLPDPLPLIRLNPRSDWADDERDTGYRFAERELDLGYLKSDGNWDRDFDFPKTSFLPQKPVQFQHETENNSRIEVHSADGSRGMSSHGGSDSDRWRTTSQLKDGGSISQVGNVGRSMATGLVNTVSYNKYSGVGGSDGNSLLKQDFKGDRGTWGLGERKESHNNCENQDAEQPSRYRDYHNNKPYKPSSVSSRNMPPTVAPALAAVRDKRFSKADGSLSDDPFMTDFDSGGFDERDFFSGSSLGVLKRKKDAKQTEFHDPVRESFEAELERVQRMQELERKRVIEEQERAAEKARREDEERLRSIREEEECQRMLEEEALKAASRAEKEKEDAAKRSEELKMAREEEKRRILMEEERSRQAARQKLLELEDKIAKRAAEAAKAGASVSSALMNDRSQGSVNDEYLSVDRNMSTWEDEERNVGKVIMSPSSDSSSHRKIIDMSSRYMIPSEGSSKGFEAEKAGYSSRLPLSDHGIRQNRPKWESFNSGRMVPQNELYGKSTYTSSRSHVKEGILGPPLGESGYQKQQIWNSSGNSNLYERHRERQSEVGSHGSEYDINWDGHPLSSTSSYRGQFYPNTDIDNFESYGRSRYSMRQPRVLPPPIASAQRTISWRATEHGPSSFPDDNILHGHAMGSDFSQQMTHHRADQGDQESYEIPQLQVEDTAITEDLNTDLIARCDSQSSLVVSSPPNSAPHLSEEDLDEAGDFPAYDSVQEERNQLPKIGSDVLDEKYGMNSTATLASTLALEDEEWPIENVNKLQRLSEYDEFDNYREEDEVCNEMNHNLSKKFDELNVGVESLGNLAEGSVLGFKKGGEIGLPSDNLVEDLATDETAFTVPERYVDINDEIGPLRNVVPLDRGPVFENESPATVNRVDSGMAETGLVSHASTGQAVGTSATAAILECVDASVSACLPLQQSDPLAGYAKNASQQTNLGASVGNSVDFPVNIQFGLFTGPTLLPASVPSIQIGSIHIPINIHDHAFPPSTHIYPSPPPTLQFGQLSYTTPILQGSSPLMSHGTGQDAFIVDIVKESQCPLNEELALNDSLPKGSSVSVDGIFGHIDGKCNLELESRVEEEAQQNSVLDGIKLGTDEGRSVNQLHGVHHRGIRSSFGEKGFSGQRGGLNGRVRRFAYAVKGANSQSSILTQDMQPESNVFQRRPLQTIGTRDKNYRRSTFQSDSSAGAIRDNSSNYLEKSRSKLNRSTVTNRRVREKIDSEPTIATKLPVNSEKTSNRNETDLGRNLSKEAIDAPLQSGVVCVFSQPGIEAPSDEDDFIEVRSKRHLHDRRKQREQGLKPKPVTSMQSHTQHFARKGGSVSRNRNKLFPSNSEMPSSSKLNVTASVASSGQHLKKEPPISSTSVYQVPSGASTVTPGGHTMKTDNGKSLTVVSHDISESGAAVMSESRDKMVEHVLPSLTHCSTERVDQQVMSLTQTQLDEAIDPARYDTNSSNIGGHSSIKSDQILPKPISARDKTFASGASAVNSLLAGEKIQLGAVTSQAVPPSNYVLSDGIGIRSNWSNVQTSHKSSEAKNDRSNVIFKEDKHPVDSPLLHEAVAKPKTDSFAANMSEKGVAEGELHSPIVPETKSFDDASGDLQVATQSQGDDSLTVSLPADLSIETTPISMWPPSPVPQNDSAHMLSHFPGAPHTHFPYYEMNRFLGSPIFNSGALDESSGTQSQLMAATSTNSVPPVNWPHHHFGMDSFYGQPIGYPGPFVGPIGVQGPPPHMALYDHFPPVGQFGQVPGLGLMGPNYFSHGKQSDWKHNPTSSAMHAGDGNVHNNSSKMAHPLTNSPHISMAPAHHLAPGSPLLSASSPSPVFDVASFQPQAGSFPSDISSPPVSVFQQAHIPLSAHSSSKISTPMDTNIAPFAAELGLVDSPSPSTTAVSSDQVVSVQQIPLGSSSTANAQSGQSLGNNNGRSQNLRSTKTWTSQKNSTAHDGRNNYPRFGLSQRNNNSGNDWPHRRTGFHGRRQSFGVDRAFPPPKMKQIYVAKQTSAGNTAN